MFKIKRPAIVGLLVVLLLFVSFINYQLTQQSILKASKNYEKYEVGQMEGRENEKDVFNEEKDGDLDIGGDEVLNDDSSEVDSVVSSRDETIDQLMEKDNDNYFVNFRLSRDKIRAESIDRLYGIVNNQMTESSLRTEAQEEIMNIGKISEKELQIEGLIQSKGFDNALVFLSLEDIKIVVSTDELSEQEMVKILDIVTSETSIEGDNIKIMRKP